MLASFLNLKSKQVLFYVLEVPTKLANTMIWDDIAAVPKHWVCVELWVAMANVGALMAKLVNVSDEH